MQFTTMDIEEPLFQPFPSDIVFQNFNPFETYQVPLQLRNNDKVNTVDQFRFIKIQPKTIDLGMRLWGINPTTMYLFPRASY